MKSNLFLAALLFLTGCIGGGIQYTKNKNSFMERLVSEETLENGNLLMVGYKDAKPEWDCKLIHKEVPDEGTLGWKTNFSLTGLRGLMKNQGVKYVNAHPGSKINYVYVDISDELFIGPIGTNVGDNYVHYYSCKNPPAKHSNPFKDSNTN